MKTGTKWLILSGAALLLLVLLLVAARWRWGPPGLRAPARRAWKDKALAELARRSADPKFVTNELAAMKAGKASQKNCRSEPWLSDHLILLENGEWLLYASICSKADRRIHDIFIGRASDGKWYYSTWHSCSYVINLHHQSKSLEDFIKEYWLREFDGRSDECLEKTGPPD